MLRLANTAILAFLFFFSTNSVSALTSVSGSGIIQDISGVDLTPGDKEGDLLFGFNERQNINGVGIEVDYLIGVNANIGDSLTGQDSSVSGLSLLSGVYDSHIIHRDPVGSNPSELSIFTTPTTFEFDNSIPASYVISVERRPVTSWDSV